MVYYQIEYQSCYPGLSNNTKLFICVFAACRYKENLENLEYIVQIFVPHKRLYVSKHAHYIPVGHDSLP